MPYQQRYRATATLSHVGDMTMATQPAPSWSFLVPTLTAAVLAAYLYVSSLLLAMLVELQPRTAIAELGLVRNGGG